MDESIPEAAISGLRQQTHVHGQPRPDYSTWSTPSLIARISELERQLHSQTVQVAASHSQHHSASGFDARASTSAPAPAPAPAPSPYPTSVPKRESESSHGKTPNKTDTEATATKTTTATTNNTKADDFTQTRAPGRPAKQIREIDPSKYHTRFIALKFAYLGQRYNGFEHTNGNYTPLPTIEEEVWKALRKTRLILPPDTGALDNTPAPLKPFSISWEGCQYSKAGRTDRGVSAFGQVIGIRVRSSRPKVQKKEGHGEHLQNANAAKQDEDRMDLDDDSNVDSKWDDIADELPYIHILNRVLPEDIKVLAWCPHPPAGFDARFSCRERRYKYFFTQPAFSPTPGPPGFIQGARDSKYREGWLDIDAMRSAAKCFEGVHDFRNFCKLDTSKQIENFQRIIYYADIELEDPQTNTPGYVGQPGFGPFEDRTDNNNNNSNTKTTAQVYSFTLHGSAFLWHQVRHMVGLLFLIGQGLESPSIVPDLLDISKNPGRPTYEMASDAPLVLWDCKFPDEKSGSREDALDWVYAGDPRMNKSQNARGDGKFGTGGIVETLWSVWRQRKIDEFLAGSFLDLAVNQGDQSNIVQANTQEAKPTRRGQKVFYGGNEGKLGGKYVQVMQKRKMEPVEVLNAKWLANKQRKKDNAPNSESI